MKTVNRWELQWNHGDQKDMIMNKFDQTFFKTLALKTETLQPVFTSVTQFVWKCETKLIYTKKEESL